MNGQIPNCNISTEKKLTFKVQIRFVKIVLLAGCALQNHFTKSTQLVVFLPDSLPGSGMWKRKRWKRQIFVEAEAKNDKRLPLPL